MIVNGKNRQSIWYDASGDEVLIIDQTRLPHEFKVLSLVNLGVGLCRRQSMQVQERL